MATHDSIPRLIGDNCLSCVLSDGKREWDSSIEILESTRLPTHHENLVRRRRLRRHGNRGWTSRCHAATAMPMRVRRTQERVEERMRHKGRRLEFRMKLAGEKPGMVRGFDDFDVFAVGRTSGDAESSVGERFFVFAIKFVPVAVAFADVRASVCAEG